MQRLIKIWPRHGNEILDTSRHRPPDIVDNSEHGVAILQGPRDYAHGKEIVDLIDGNVLPLQLLVNAVKALDAAFDLCLDAGLFQLVVNDGLHLGEKDFALFAASVDGLFNLLVACGIKKQKAQVFQLAANFSHAEAMRDGRINLESFFSNFALAIGRQGLKGAHVVQPVSQFDEHHADVINHGQHHLAQIFSLRFLTRGEVDLAYFRDAFDDMRDLLAKILADVDDCDRGVFD